MTNAITFTLDGREVEARPGETIWQVARRQGTLIPHLCWLPEPGYRADGNCRACMVEIEGERALAASCIRKPRAWRWSTHAKSGCWVPFPRNRYLAALPRSA
jgi:formate dehydrogenase major subunit